MGLLQANGKSMCMWYLPAAETFGGGFFVLRGVRRAERLGPLGPLGKDETWNCTQRN